MASVSTITIRGKVYFSTRQHAESKRRDSGVVGHRETGRPDLGGERRPATDDRGTYGGAGAGVAVDGGGVHDAEAAVVAGLGGTQVHHGLTVPAWGGNTGDRRS